MRTDIHSPKVFDPQDYQVVDYLDLKRPMPPYAPVSASKAAREAWEGVYASYLESWEKRIMSYFPNWRTGGEDHTSVHQCNHCGHNPIRWCAVVKHLPSGNFLSFGEICAERAELDTRDEFERKMSRKAREAEIRRLEIEAKRAVFAAENADVIEFLKKNENDSFSFVRDMVGELRRNGRLSEAQTGAMQKIMAKRAAWEADKAKEVKPEQPVTFGRQDIEGEVLGIKTVYFNDEPTWKMRVRLDDGNVVYGTIPKSLRAAVDHYQDLTHKRVKLSAEVFKHGADDPHFGIYKKPTKAVIA